MTVAGDYPVRDTVATSRTLAGGAIIASAFVLAALIQLPLPVNHDAAWVLIGAGRLLDGAAFGRDVVDVNPPLAWWLSMPPHLLSGWTGMALTHAFKLYVLALCAVSVWLTHRLLRAGADDTTPTGAITGLLAVLLTVTPGYDFGQREHLMVILAAPYLGLALCRANHASVPPALALGCATLAAVSFCLKPYFLLIAAAVELFVFLALGRAWRPVRIETAIMVALGIAYIAVVWITAPAYFTDVAHDARYSYGAYSSDWNIVIRRSFEWIWPFSLGLTLWYALCRKDLAGPAALLFLWVAAGAAVTGMLQQKGWQYHFYPLVAFSALALLGLAAGKGGKPLLRVATVPVLAVIAFIAAREPYKFAQDGLTGGEDWATVAGLTHRLEQHTGANGRVFAFLTSPRAVMPALLETGRHWAGSACCVHFLPAVIQDKAGVSGVTPEEADMRAAIASRQLDGIAATLQRDLPDMLVVDDSRFKAAYRGILFDYVEYLSRLPRFATIFAHYAEIDGVGDFRLFVKQNGR